MPDLDMTWLDDEDFCWQAAVELLTALGCSPLTVQRLAQARPWVAADTTSTSAAEVDALAGAFLPAARETLDRLAAERIRPEVLGIEPDVARLMLLDLQEAWEEGAWRTLSGDELDVWIDARMAPYLGSGRRSAAQTPVLVEPVAPEHGEVGRIVDVLRRMPKETIVRIAKVWNPIALRAVVAGGLLAMRRSRSGAGSGRHAAGTGRANAATGPTEPTAPVTAEEIEEQRRRIDDQLIAMAETWPEGFLMPKMGAEARGALAAAVGRRVDAGGSVPPAVLEHLPADAIVRLQARGMTTTDSARAREQARGDSEARRTGYGDWSGVAG